MSDEVVGYDYAKAEPQSEFWGPIEKLAAALAKAQAEFSPVLKSSNNPFYKSKYADLSAVIDATRPALSKHGLAVVQLPAMDGTYVSVTTLLIHESGAGIRSVLSMPTSKPDVQGAGSAITYARRFSYQAIVHVAGEEDDDGNRAAGKKPEDSDRGAVVAKKLKELGFEEEENAVKQWEQLISNCVTASDFDGCAGEMKNAPTKAKMLLMKAAADKGFKYDREAQGFVPIREKLQEPRTEANEDEAMITPSEVAEASQEPVKARKMPSWEISMHDLRRKCGIPDDEYHAVLWEQFHAKHTRELNQHQRIKMQGYLLAYDKPEVHQPEGKELFG